MLAEPFRRIADTTAAAVGSPGAFSATVVVTAVWLILGPVFSFSDTWQLSMNMIASQVTFLIALLLQTPERDTRALQLKLDELIRSTGNARTSREPVSTVRPTRLAYPDVLRRCSAGGVAAGD